jgi:hypothetical protein
MPPHYRSRLRLNPPPDFVAHKNDLLRRIESQRSAIAADRTIECIEVLYGRDQPIADVTIEAYIDLAEAERIFAALAEADHVEGIEDEIRSLHPAEERNP